MMKKMRMMAIVVVGRNEVLQLTVVDSRMKSDDVGGCDGENGENGEDGGCGGVDSWSRMRQRMMMREQVEDMRCEPVDNDCCCGGGDTVRRRRLGDGNYCYYGWGGDDGGDDMGRWEILSLGKIAAVAVAVVVVYLVGSDHCVHSNVVVVGCHGENGGNSGGGGGWSDIVVLWCRRESWDHCCCCCCCCSDGCSGWRTGAS